MSIDWAAVQFPDGEVRWTIHDLVDEIVPELSTDLDVVRAAGRAWGGDVVEPIGEIVPVEIYSNYDGGTHWRGRAARNCVVEGCDSIVKWTGLESEPPIFDGRPEWVGDALRAAGKHDWVWHEANPPNPDPVGSDAWDSSLPGQLADGDGSGR